MQERLWNNSVHMFHAHNYMMSYKHIHILVPYETGTRMWMCLCTVCWEEYLELRHTTQEETRESCIMRSPQFLLLCILSHGSDDKCIKSFGQRTWKEETSWETKCRWNRQWCNIPELFLRKHGMGVGTNGGPLLTKQWTLRQVSGHWFFKTLLCPTVPFDESPSMIFN
jgi:hypothetical protein